MRISGRFWMGVILAAMAGACGGGGSGTPQSDAGPADASTQPDAAIVRDAGPDAETLQFSTYPTLTGFQSEEYRYRAGVDRGGQPSFVLKSGPAGATIDGNGFVSWTPSPAQSPGDHKFRIAVELDGLTAEQSFTIHVGKVVLARSQEVSANQSGTSVVSVDEPLSAVRGASVIIPEGALPGGGTLTIGSVEDAATLPAAEVGNGSTADVLVVDMGPSGTVFSSPVSVVVPISQSVADSALSTGKPVAVWTLDSRTGAWEQLRVLHTDLPGRTVVAETSHFSQFAGVLQSEVLTELNVQSASCSGLMTMDLGLALPLTDVPTHLLNGYDSAIDPSNVGQLVQSLAGRMLKVVFAVKVRTGAEEQGYTAVLNVVGRSDNTVDIRVTDGSGLAIYRADGVDPSSQELIRLLAGGAAHLVLPKPSSDGVETTVSVTPYGFVGNVGPLGAPASLGTALGTTATATADFQAIDSSDSDCDGVRNADDATPNGVTPPLCTTPQGNIFNTLVGTEVELGATVTVAPGNTATTAWTTDVNSGSLVPNGNSAVFSSSIAGSYRVFAEASNAAGASVCSFAVFVQDPVMSTNTPPSCDIAASATQVFVGDQVQLKAYGKDAEQPSNELSFAWTHDFGSVSGDDSEQIEITSEVAGDIVVRCAAHDGIEAGSASSLVLSFSERPVNVPPVITFVSPVSNTAVVAAGEGAEQKLYAAGYDADGDNISFQFEVVDGNASLLTGHDDPNSASRTLQADTAGSYKVRVRATDSRGAVSAAQTMKFYVVVDAATVDADGDGYPGGLDCNDNDPNVNPSVVEICGDDIDQDCTGADRSIDACDIDGDGYSVLQGDCDDEDPTRFPSAYEYCNGRDDNCNGQSDEDYQVGTSCSAGQGVCYAGGVTVCGTGGVSVVCNAVMGTPTEEICNSVDDNCNGVIDDTDASVNDTIENCGGCNVACSAQDNQQPLCEQDASGIYGCSTVCQAGFQDLDGDSSNGCEYACTVTGEEICDGLDNNCDGNIDEDTSEYFYSGPVGTDGVGACRQGYQVCENGQLVVVNQAVLPKEEECDGIDSDCDGSVDENFSEEATECADGVGACYAAGTLVCVGGKVTCSEQPGQPTGELCDGQDHDCDGIADNISGTCDTGEPGVCSTGYVVCVSGSVECVAEHQPSEEVCGDGLDNNCDGIVDTVNCHGDKPGESCEQAIVLNIDAPEPQVFDLAYFGDQVPSVCAGSEAPTNEAVFEFTIETATYLVIDTDGSSEDVRFSVKQDCGKADGEGSDCIVGGDLESGYAPPGTYYVVAEAPADGDGTVSFTMSSCVDADGDEYGAASCGGPDCDDNDATIHPGSKEICGDGVDNNCDSVIDEPTDNDDDGYVDVACGGDSDTDCDDMNPYVHPDAEEICSDSLDNNCDGSVDEEGCQDIAPGEQCSTSEYIDIHNLTEPITGNLNGYSADVSSKCFGKEDGGPAGEGTSEYEGGDRVYRFDVGPNELVIFNSENSGYSVGFEFLANSCEDGDLRRCAGPQEVTEVHLEEGTHYLLVKQMGPGDGDYEFTLSVCGDADHDGRADAACGGTDCNDSDDSINDHSPEICGDSIDNNCNGEIDEPEDFDHDGFYSVSCDGNDCDDFDPSVHPDRVESCDDGVDNNCDGQVDEESCVVLPPGDTCSQAIDVDINGGVQLTGNLSEFGADIGGGCFGGSGPDIAYRFVLPTDSGIVMDGSKSGYGTGLSIVRDNCNGDHTFDCMVGGDTDLRYRELPAGEYYVTITQFGSAGDSQGPEGGDGNYDFFLSACVDADQDGHADAACGGDDCDDSDSSVHPYMAEVCGDNIDNNCNQEVDEASDNDKDGYGTATCGGSDCNDNDPSIHPGTSELCGDGIDNNCSGSIDDETCVAELAGDSCESAVPLEFLNAGFVEGNLAGYQQKVFSGCYSGHADQVFAFSVNEESDLAFDTNELPYGTGISIVADGCEGGQPVTCFTGGQPSMAHLPPGDYHLVVTQMDTLGPTNYHLGVSECVDADFDGHLDAACGGDDCNDADSGIHPFAGEVCGDNIDNNCDGKIDEFADHDFDGYYAAACGGDDCDDNDPTTHPNANEVCTDGKDNNCDSVVDEEGCQGGPLLGDSCESATEIDVVNGAYLSGDLFGYKPDLASTCGGDPSAPNEDQVFHFYLPEGQFVSFNMEESGQDIGMELRYACGEMDNLECVGGGEVRSTFLESGDYWMVLRHQFDGPGFYSVLVSSCYDADQDGYADSSCGGDDCDDSNPGAHPFAEELCDGFDNNCDGTIDENCF